VLVFAQRYAKTSTRAHTRAHTHTHAHTRTCTCTYIHTHMHTHTHTRTNIQGLAKTIKELAAQRRVAAGSSQQTSPDASPSFYADSHNRHHHSYNASPPLPGSSPSPSSSTPSVMSSVYSPATHYTPNSSRPNTTLAPVEEVQVRGVRARVCN